MTAGMARLNGGLEAFIAVGEQLKPAQSSTKQAKACYDQTVFREMVCRDALAIWGRKLLAALERPNSSREIVLRTAVRGWRASRDYTRELAAVLGRGFSVDLRKRNTYLWDSWEVVVTYAPPL